MRALKCGQLNSVGRGLGGKLADTISTAILKFWSEYLREYTHYIVSVIEFCVHVIIIQFY